MDLHNQTQALWASLLFGGRKLPSPVFIQHRLVTLLINMHISAIDSQYTPVLLPLAKTKPNRLSFNYFC